MHFFLPGVRGYHNALFPSWGEGYHNALSLPWGEGYWVVLCATTGWACVGPRPDFKSKSVKIGWIPASFLQPVSALDESCIDHSVDYAHFNPPRMSTVKEEPGTVCVCVFVCVCVCMCVCVCVHVHHSVTKIICKTGGICFADTLYSTKVSRWR